MVGVAGIFSGTSAQRAGVELTEPDRDHPVPGGSSEGETATAAGSPPWSPPDRHGSAAAALAFAALALAFTEAVGALAGS